MKGLKTVVDTINFITGFLNYALQITSGPEMLSKSLVCPGKQSLLGTDGSMPAEQV